MSDSQQPEHQKHPSVSEHPEQRRQEETGHEDASEPSDVGQPPSQGKNPKTFIPLRRLLIPRYLREALLSSTCSDVCIMTTLVIPAKVVGWYDAWLTVLPETYSFNVPRMMSREGSTSAPHC